MNYALIGFFARLVVTGILLSACALMSVGLNLSKRHNTLKRGEELEESDAMALHKENGISTHEMERTTSTTSTNCSYDEFSSASSTTTEQSLSMEQIKTGEPANFGVVVPGVYRSSYPKASNYGFLEGLKLKTIVTLVDKDLPETYKPFIQSHGIRHHIVSMKGTKKEEIPLETMKSILSLVLDRKNHPVLIHCNHGRHRTGCVVAIVRKISGWDTSAIVDEYTKFATPKIRECDVDYINQFDLATLSALFQKPTPYIRVRNFMRTLIFTFFIVLLWLGSMARMGMPRRMEVRIRPVEGATAPLPGRVSPTDEGA